MNEEWKKKFKYGILFAVITIVCYAAVMNLGSVIRFFEWAIDIAMPLLVGFMIAVVLNTPMRGLQKLLGALAARLRNTISISENVVDIAALTLTITGTFLLVFLIFRVVVPQVIESVSGIADMVIKNYPKLLRLLQKYGVNTGSIEELVEYLNIQSLLGKMSANASSIAGKAFSAASSVLGAVVNGLTGFVIAVYILANKKTLKRQSKKLLYAYAKPQHADRLCRVAALCDDTFFRFISGQCLEACILGMMFFVTMCVLRMPYASVISVFIAFMALIPYVGAFLGMLVGFLLIVMVNPMQAVAFVVMFLIIQQIEGQFIYPRVVGNSVGLPAMWTMIAALLGGAMFGLVGMVFFIPITSVIYSLLRENMNRQLDTKKINL